MKLHGWGRYPTMDAKLHEPVDADSVRELLAIKRDPGALLARGAGRSYGDNALAPQLLSTRRLDNFIAFDTTLGTLHCAAGVTLGNILQITVAAGWFLPVVPGTQFVTVGGAIANDVHGKNHHVDGCFSQFVHSLRLMLASGEILQCSTTENAEVFRATCGGIGLTGVILECVLQLRRIHSTSILQQTLPAANLEEIFAHFEAQSGASYSVAWLDCMATGPSLGRAVLFCGEHEKDAVRRQDQGFSVAVPFRTPAFFLNSFSVRYFNRAYFALNSRTRPPQSNHYQKFFFPLDRIRNWNLLYGRKGFLQYQFVVPLETALNAIAEVLGKIGSSGKGSFLCVLKKMGEANANFLSFPMQGYTLALDFKNEKSIFPLLETLDAIVLAHGGRFYLAKDAHMSERTFKSAFPQWEIFMQLRSRLDPHGVFGSLQSHRIGLQEFH